MTQQAAGSSLERAGVEVISTACCFGGLVFLQPSDKLSFMLYLARLSIFTLHLQISKECCRTAKSRATPCWQGLLQGC